MKRSNLLAVYVILSFLTLCITYSIAKPYQEIHHLFTEDEREAIFGHPFAEYVPEYDITHPVQVDASGRLLSRDLANGNGRRKREIGSSSKEPVYFKLSGFGQDFHVNVTLNHDLFSANFEIEIRGNNSSEFHNEIDHCHYIGQLLPAEGKRSRNKVALSNCDGLQGMISTQQDIFMIHPVPDRLSLGKNKTRAHVIHRRSLAPVQTLGKAMEAERRSDSWCGVEGKSKFEQSYDSSEPHSNFRRSSDMNRQRTIESMIVVEKVMTKFYGVQQIKRYVPTIVNVAHGLLADASIGANIKYIIHKLLILEQDMPGLVLSTHAASTLSSFCKWTTGQNIADDNNPRHFDHAALISKYNFCRNKGQVKGEGCGTILGLADLKGMCKRDTSCTLNKDTGLGTAFTMAHETAHNLGSEHDEEGNKCKDGVYIMAARASGKITAFDWSPCSRNYITNFLQTAQSECLNDKADHKVPIPEGKPGRLYDGNDQCVRMFGSGSRVCDIRDLKEKMCVNLYCEKPDGYCSSNDEPAADGTTCGRNKWCSYGRCVTVGSKGSQDVDGNWGAWEDWSQCYPSCGGGLSKRIRKCNNPSPKRGGKLCEGKGTEYKYCNKKCPPNSENPRMTQCKRKRNVQFEGGQTFNWIYDPYYARDSPKCILSCATRQGDTTTFGSVKDGTPCSDTSNSGVCVNGQCKTVGCDGALDSRAKKDRCGVCNGDGSSCSGGNQGNKPRPPTRPTRPVPAPSGQLRKFTYDKVPGYDYYQTIATLPVGARNIKIQEVIPSENNLMLEDSDFNTVPNYEAQEAATYGTTVYSLGGTTFSFKKQNQQETFVGVGPLTKSLTLLYEANDENTRYKVMYQYVIGGSQSRWSLTDDTDLPELFREIEEVDKELSDAKAPSQDEEKAKMKWIMSSEECSVSCGGGIERVSAICVREDDESQVGDQFCEEKRPGDKFKECNTQGCPARWEVGSWTECSKSCNDGTRGVKSREVFCVEDSQGTEVEISDIHCKTPKPASQEECGTEPCPAEWYTVHNGSCSTSCGPGVQPLQVKCVKINSSGQTATVDEKECTDFKPPSHVSCNTDNPCGDDMESQD